MLLRVVKEVQQPLTELSDILCSFTQIHIKHTSKAVGIALNTVLVPESALSPFWIWLFRSLRNIGSLSKVRKQVKRSPMRLYWFHCLSAFRMRLKSWGHSQPPLPITLARARYWASKQDTHPLIQVGCCPTTDHNPLPQMKQQYLWCTAALLFQQPMTLGLSVRDNNRRIELRA